MMTKDGELRIATWDGAMLGTSAAEIFEPAYWAARGELEAVSAGRGAAWFVAEAGRWVLRHYRRGGWMARLSADGYLWTGEERVRAFAEWRLLAELARRHLPVPVPVAARYRRLGLWYRCDLVTERVAGARPLSALLAHGDVDEIVWRRVGVAVARLHAAGVDHADLNAHNILLDSEGTVTVIDFDRGRLRPPGGWQESNLSRLRRSLRKISRAFPPGRFSGADWEALLAEYARSVGRDP